MLSPFLALLKETGRNKERVTAIGNHGQTVFHQPTGKTPFTIQLGDANIIAARTGITTIADFLDARISHWEVKAHHWSQPFMTLYFAHKNSPLWC